MTKHIVPPLGGVIYVDGASKGNPGPSAYAYVVKIFDANGKHIETVEGSGYLGHCTAIFAEWFAIYVALRRAKQLGLEYVTIYSDCNTIVLQCNRKYGVKSSEYRKLATAVKSLMGTFVSCKIVFLPRQENRVADMLASDVAKWIQYYHLLAEKSKDFQDHSQSKN